MRWKLRSKTERTREQTEQSFCVPKADIVAEAYDLSVTRYRKTVHDDAKHRAPKAILSDLARLEAEIEREMKELERVLG
jgi:type I restriction enzyme M protein